MKYDDAGWHYGSNFPVESPMEYSGIHIALFLKYCFIKGWAGDIHLETEPEDTKKVIDGSMLATEFLFKYCDGKLTNEDFNEQGNAFAEKYYSENSLYLEDYEKHFKNKIYTAGETEIDYNKFSSMIESRLLSGVLTLQHVKVKTPWWKFW